MKLRFSGSTPISAPIAACSRFAGLAPGLPGWLAAIAVAFTLIAPVAAQSEECMECHQDATLTMERGGKPVSLFVDAGRLGGSMHGGMSCTECHEGFDPGAIPHREPMEPASCLSCHGDLGKSHPFHPNIGKLTQTGSAPDVACAGCHGAHDIVAIRDPDFRFSPARRAESCATCHEAEGKAFTASAHHGQPAGGRLDCFTCHESADVVMRVGADLLATKKAQSALCLSCHVDKPEVAAQTRLGGKFVASWGSSVHGLALAGGRARAANCVDCHGSHEMTRATVADSRVNKLHIPDTCRQCHQKEARDFATGVHADALAHGAIDAPVCTDCHGEHLILRTDDPLSPVAPRNVSQQLCGECHGSVRLSQKYGISSDRFRTFADSYHGLAVRGGAVEVVNCASCHGVHAILRSSDPRSPVNKANLAQTCGQCHPGANETFAVGSVHMSMAPAAGIAGIVGEGAATARGEPVVQIIATIYVWGILIIVGGMVVHNALDFFKKVRRKVRGHVEGVRHAEPLPHRLYLRMTVNERLQHGALVLSFVVLVVTGFMLRFPEAWWVVGLRELNGHLFEWRGWMHRIAAVAMVAAGVWHVSYVSFTARGRELMRDLLPRLGDFRDAWGVLRYNLGLAREKPAFGRFSYIEKTEYWALLWGSILMSATGVLLWADDQTMGVFGKLGFDVARTVHFYEAILATLAIIVWHFYFVIFNPEVYPMNLSWLTGYLSEEEMAGEHPQELERLRGEQKDEGGKRAGDAAPPGDGGPPKE